MNLTNILNDVKTLEHIVCIYNDNYVEVGKVHSDTDVSWTPMEKSELYDTISQSMQINKKVFFIMPKNILYFSAIQQMGIFYFSPQRRTLLFHKNESLNVPLPGMVFICHKKKVSVYCYKKAARPDENTVMYKNVLPNGCFNVCFGNVKMEPTYDNPQRLIDYIENRYFNASFTNENTYNILKGISDKNYYNFMKSIQSVKSFPKKMLIKESKLIQLI